MLVNIQDVKDYLGIEFEDEAVNRRLNHLIKVSEKTLEGSLGAGFPIADDRVKELALIIIADLYDNRALHDKVGGNVRRLITDFSLQIRLEMRRNNKKRCKNGI